MLPICQQSYHKPNAKPEGIGSPYGQASCRQSFHLKMTQLTTISG